MSPSPSGQPHTYGVGISRQITFDGTTGIGSIPFTVGNSTERTQPARDVYAFSTNELKILDVPGCVPAKPLSSAWGTTFRCTLPELKPGEQRSWTATVQYAPAIRADEPRAARAAVRLPLEDSALISTFCVVVVPQGATNLDVVLGQDGPLRLAFGSNDPNVIGFTIAPGSGGNSGGSGGGSRAGSAGGSGGTAGGGNGGNGPNAVGGGSGGGSTDTGGSGTSGSLPKTGFVPWGLSMAGGALGLLILGTAMVGFTRMRRRRDLEA
ncbi:hypothetical protein GCM10023205_54530 [Yinghuangia aomiensis]|uniref:Uncharacterized protein n=1 Tax=Yinghuangia aomiensis TaxID=676205 RepID=A0ABP9HV81_9ACTN